MKTTLLRSFTLIFCFICCSASAHWVLLADQSSLSFVSTKNQNFSELHHFKTLQAEFDAEGKLSLEIDLTSIDSGIAIRDTRMREKLFIVDKFPKATLSAQLTDSVLKLGLGKSISTTIPAQLSIMGISKTISVSVQVTRTADNSIVATSTQPILISAADFGLTAGLDILQKLAGLSGIGQTVPVNFNLVFFAH
jgi:polyisoprenoid-binding protein YceI